MGLLAPYVLAQHFVMPDLALKMTIQPSRTLVRHFSLSLVAIFCSSTALGSTRVCTGEEAQKAEVAVSVGRSWAQLHRDFAQYAHCDDGAIGEGFSETITLLLAEHWDDVRQISPMITSDPSFRKFIIRHIDDTVPEERLERIARNANKQCPRNLKSLCREIQAAATK